MSRYFDHAATAPMLPAALDAYVRVAQTVGNASSVHTAGQRARAIVEEGRHLVAASVGAESAEVIFTSGGTEAINQAIKGVYWARQQPHPRPIVIITAGEHAATIEAATWLADAQGADLHVAPIGRDAIVDLAWLEDELQTYGDRIALISILWANNEVGALQPVRRIVELASTLDVPVHADAIAAYGQVAIDFDESGLTALSVAAHKIGGPLGTGALVVRRTQTLVPLLHGGGQERRVRSGTIDTPAIAAFGVAAHAVSEDLDARVGRLAQLRDRLIAGISRDVPDAIVTGPSDERLPGNVHVIFPGCEGDSLLFLLDQAGFDASTGSACAAGVPQPSHVLTAMGFAPELARSALRFTLGSETAEADIDAILGVLPDVVARARRAGLSAREPQRF